MLVFRQRYYYQYLYNNILRFLRFLRTHRKLYTFSAFLVSNCKRALTITRGFPFKEEKKKTI